MAIRNAQYGTYNQTVGVRLDMDDAIKILSPSDVPLQGWLPTETTNEVKVEWLEEDLTPQSDTIASVTGSGPWTPVVSDTNIFRVGDVLWKEGAASAVQYVVDSVTNGTTMVVSGFAGNAVAPVAADVLTIVGQYNVEGGDPLAPRSVERTSKYNYTQIGQEQVAATRTARTRGQRGGLYGQMDPYDHEVGKKFKELAIRYERSLVHGQRAISGGADKRFMGGLLYYITSNTVSGVKANAGTLIGDLLKKCYDAGGTPSTLMVSPAVKVAISRNVDVAGRRTTRTERTGGSVIDEIETDFGTVNLVVNRFFPPLKGILMERDYLSRVVFDGYFHELLAKTGDADKGEIVGEFTLKVKNEKAHGVLTITDA